MVKKKDETQKKPEPKQGKMMAIIGEISEIRFIDDLSELQDEVDMEEYCETDHFGFTGKAKGGVDTVTDQYHSEKVIAVFEATKKGVIKGVNTRLESKYVIERRGK